MPATPPCLLAFDRASFPDAPLTTITSDAEAAGATGLILPRAQTPFDPSLFVPDVLKGGAKRLELIIALDPGRFPIDHPLVASHPDLFAVRRDAAGMAVVDPRRAMPAAGEARARLRSERAWSVLREPIGERLRQAAREGATGFRLPGASAFAPDFLAELAADLRGAGLKLIVDAAAFDRTVLRRLKGLDGIVSSFGWWDGRAPWLIEEYDDLRAAAPLLAEILHEAPVTALAAAVVGDGLILPASLMGTDDTGMTGRAIALSRIASVYRGTMRRLSASGAAVTALLRTDADDIRAAERGLIAVMNPTDTAQPMPDIRVLAAHAGVDFGPFRPTGEGDDGDRLEPGAVRLLSADRASPIVIDTDRDGADAQAEAAAEMPRLVLERVTPRVDGGDFPVRRVAGETVEVEAILFGDGHEQLAAELVWRTAEGEEPQRTRMEQLPNDRWRAAFPLERMGRHRFAVEGWLDRFGGFQRDFARKRDAAVATPVDQAEGHALIETALDRTKGEGKKALKAELAKLAAARDADAAAAILLSPELRTLMDTADDRPHRIVSAEQAVDAERLQARYSSWYELFPRSMSGSKDRHGTFADVVAHLPRIRDMGFDTLYFPPIHPIGTTNRKGPNNTLTPELHDVGSPYAIGSPDGGHDAIHPELGSFEDFGRLIGVARDHGLEIALDFAIQCSPDHPWLKEHPGWFAWRPDGSMKYAENPPKKYQDIVNVDFYGPDAVPGLWLGLRDVVLLWVSLGVKVFRVDNPHTKPLPFWEWMIGEVRAAHPEVIFLAEAFTRPAMMYRLAKVGFSQSYTYFTWRDGKQELIDYVTELTTTAPKEFYRPHFFVNTPDINPPYLQTSGRAGFRVRAALAATLSGLFGVYAGFELCERAALPGREEYLDSEKYEIRPRDWNAPGNIVGDITLLNRLRRAHPALQTHLNTRFLVAHNDAMIYYAKPSPDGSDMILVVVNLDPHRPQEADFEVPLWEFGLPDHGSITVEDLVRGDRFQWHGKMQHIRVEPDEPYRIWRIGGVA